MKDERKDTIRNQDAPQTGSIPESQEERLEKTPMPEVTDGGRDPSRVPSSPGEKVPNLKPHDEQNVAEKEVLEGIDRAENDQRRAAQSPSERPLET